MKDETKKMSGTPPAFFHPSTFTLPLMPDVAPNSDLLPSLRRLVRGLSALFWGLPLALLAGIPTALTGWLRELGPLPPLAAAGLLYFGVAEIGRFQPQERVWRQAWDRASILALVNLGLAPFLFFWGRMPDSDFYAGMAALLVFTGLLFLHSLNTVLQRLAAMLPDETLRADIRALTAFSQPLVRGAMVLLALSAVLSFVVAPPLAMSGALEVAFALRKSLFTVLVLAPVAITMTLLWKTKETVLASVFSGKS